METIIAAAIAAAASLAVSLITNRAQYKQTQALLDYRLRELEKKVEVHNKVIERTYKLEGQMTEAQHDIKDLKGYHKPNN